MRATMRLLLLSAGLVCFEGAACAQDAWPAKPIRLIVANAAGAAVDTGARMFASSLGAKVGQAVAVDNRPGADGILAAEVVARAAPDGYTLFFTSLSVTAINPHTRKSMPFDVERDFTHIAVLIDDAGAIGLFASPSAPFSSLQEMLGYARANPGKLTFAISVPFFDIIASWIEKRAGIQTLHVPYKSVGQAGQDVMAGRVSLFMTNFGSFESFVKAGKVRALAVTRAVEDWPQIPTVASAVPGFTISNFFTLSGPAGMSPQLAQRINRATAAVVEDPKFKQDIIKLEWRNLAGARTPEGTVEYLRGQRDIWGMMTREIGLQPQ